MWSVFGVACSVPVLLLVAVSVAIVWRWWRIRSAKRVPIASASRREGYFEIAGTVEARDAFGHPLTDEPVAWVTISAELVLEPVPEDPGDTKRRLTGEMGEAIWLRDESGLARVDPRAATLEISDPQMLDYDRRRDGDPPEWVLDLVARSHRPLDPARIRRARGVASLVHPGDPLYVLGWATPERSAEGLYRDAQVIPVFRQRIRRPLLLANMEQAELETHELGLALFVLFVAGLLTAAWWGLFGGLW